jgi:predicted outer membrane repeat protein
MYDNAAINNNRASSAGGGFLGSELFMYDNSTISYNYATRGGGIRSGGITLIGNSSVHSNTSSNSAGIRVFGSYFFDNQGYLIMADNSSVYNNTAANSYGGGVALEENTKLSMLGGIIYGNVESGAPIGKANSAPFRVGASIWSVPGNTLLYGDGTEIHTEYLNYHGLEQYFRDDTIVGKK